MKKIAAIMLLSSVVSFGQTTNPPPKHPKWHKVGHAAKTTATAAGSVVLLGLVIVGAGGTNVKVYSN